VAKQAIVVFFRPSILVIMLMAAMLSSIAIPAQFRLWSPDSGEVIVVGKPKPPFYDELKAYHLD
jgi:hypothetical protein